MSVWYPDLPASSAPRAMCLVVGAAAAVGASQSQLQLPMARHWHVSKASTCRAQWEPPATQHKTTPQHASRQHHRHGRQHGSRTHGRGLVALLLTISHSSIFALRLASPVALRSYPPPCSPHQKTTLKANLCIPPCASTWASMEKRASSCSP